MMSMLLVGILSLFTAQAVEDLTIYSPSISCTDQNAFRCDESEHECIPKELVCNGISECTTGIDEDIKTCDVQKPCNIVTKTYTIINRSCLVGEFECNSTLCIDMIRRCDMTKDCSNGMDEENCNTYECPKTHFKCDNEFCVPRHVLCDYINDCRDNSDELNCNYPYCFDSQFECANKQCVSLNLLCDGEQDCLDGSDEINCDKYPKCKTGFHTFPSKMCDGWEDCEDQSDETNCGVCDGYRCRNGRCIHKANRCDAYCDCKVTCDDEQNCGPFSCPVGEKYTCQRFQQNERCIDKKYLCDGINDCRNSEQGDDETNCLNKSQNCLDFGPNLFLCPEGRCIPLSAKCDHRYDCVNGEDELNCAFDDCDVGEFKCNNSQCIKNSFRCDGKFQCFDWSDEEHCDTIPCASGLRRCDSGSCIPAELWCDYFTDCPDASDEANCDYRKCRDEEFTCLNGQCIDRKYVCYKEKGNRRSGCADESNLHICGNSTCTQGQFKCHNAFCIDNEMRCDDNIDCPRISYDDEVGCPYRCPYLSMECICQLDEVNCTGRNLSKLPQQFLAEKMLTKFILSGNRLFESMAHDTFDDFERLIHLDVSDNSIKKLPVGIFKNLYRLLSLNLENNELRMLMNETFKGLSSVRSLYLKGNKIEKILPFALTGMSQLRTLDLSGQRISVLLPSTFVGLRSVSSLDLSGNRIGLIFDGAFSGLHQLISLRLSENQIQVVGGNVFHGLPSLLSLETDEFRFCCLANVLVCKPEPDEFSSCEDLMSNYLLRITVWILGTIAFFGNLLVFIWRVRDDRNGKVHSFLITNLAVGDFFMGVYLLIIAVVDTYYRGRYIIWDKKWRESDLCKFAGFISTFSSELSVFTLTVITIDRLICIIFPLKLKRLGLKQASIVMPCIWILVIFLSGFPLFGLDYFENFYGRSGVCLAFHITSEKPKGWEYSVFVFLVLNFLSFLVIFISYIWMFLVAKKTTTAVRKSKAKSDKSMAKRMTLIVMSDFCCWVPIILLGFASLGGANVPPQVYAWVAVFVLPLNSAINPILYTISTAPFMRNIRKRASNFRKSITGSWRTSGSDTKNSFIDGSSQIWNRNSMYRQLELTRLRGLKKTYSHNNHEKAMRIPS